MYCERVGVRESYVTVSRVSSSRLVRAGQQEYLSIQHQNKLLKSMKTNQSDEIDYRALDVLRYRYNMVVEVTTAISGSVP